ncbi:4255_t:CDS:2, partial [Paraglomus brasilianum]
QPMLPQRKSGHPRKTTQPTFHPQSPLALPPQFPYPPSHPLQLRHLAFLIPSRPITSNSQTGGFRWLMDNLTNNTLSELSSNGWKQNKLGSSLILTQTTSIADMLSVETMIEIRLCKEQSERQE